MQLIYGIQDFFVAIAAFFSILYLLVLDIFGLAKW